MKAAFVCLAFLLAVQTARPQGKTYYVDAIGGNDLHNGRSPDSAWQTLTKVNALTCFGGDTILFKAGAAWTGQLKPKGSGRLNKPVVIDLYGGTAKPVINGGGVAGEGAVYLYNQAYWEINNLEITNDDPVAADRRGILIAAGNFGVVHHIYLKNLFIHNVKGIVDASSDAAKRTAGIGFETTVDNINGTRFDDILIEGCTIAYCENTGLYTDNLVSRSDYPQSAGWLARRFTNVRIRNNVIHHISKNAMILRLFDHGVVEGNVCYETALKVTGNTMFTVSCDGTVFQYNEGYLNRARENDPNGGDGSMYDADLQSRNIVFQYSYSHDNSHGLFWNCTVQADSGIICRYNISQNDKGIIFCVNYPVTSIAIYNNTVYSGPGLTPTIISERNLNSGTRTYSFVNNIIYNLSPNAQYDFRTSGYMRTISNNLFYGYHPPGEPADTAKLTSDPKFVSPGTGGTGIASLDGYKLLQASPCVNTGIQFADHSTIDFWSNPVPSGGAVDRGANEYQAAGAVDDHGAGVPAGYALGQNYPNPFNPETVIEYTVGGFGNQASGVSDVRLVVYDLLGREIARLVEGQKTPGIYSVIFDGTGLGSGVYFYMLTAGSYKETRRMLLMR